MNDRLNRSELISVVCLVLIICGTIVLLSWS